MNASAKYLIHATVRTNGVVERSDVVGAIFGQTEGLLGDQLDLHELQESSKLGRLDVDIESEGGRSVGSITISSGLDRVETAVLAAALETIDRVGPCRAECTVTGIEDARAAKRRELVDRATELLTDLEESTVTSEEIVEDVRKQARVAEITEYDGIPAGPRVANSDAIIVVEGRADVRRLLKFGIRNAIAVEGTNVPPEIAELSVERNTTAFLDGDRGGDLILRELQQVGDVDYVAFAPPGQSVEDLDRTAILSALRRKVPFEQVGEDESPREAFGPTDEEDTSLDTEPETTAVGAPSDGDETTGQAGGRTIPAQNTVQGNETSDDETVELESDAGTGGTEMRSESVTATTEVSSTTEEDSADSQGTELEQSQPGDESVSVDADDTVSESVEGSDEPRTLAGHVEEVIGQAQGTVRFLDDEFDVVAETELDDVFERLDECEQVPASIVIDGTLTQRLLDLAAQRGVGQIVTTATGEFVKQPTDVRVRAASDLEVNA